MSTLVFAFSSACSGAGDLNLNSSLIRRKPTLSDHKSSFHEANPEPLQTMSSKQTPRALSFEPFRTLESPNTLAKSKLKLVSFLPGAGARCGARGDGETPHPKNLKPPRVQAKACKPLALLSSLNHSHLRPRSPKPPPKKSPEPRNPGIPKAPTQHPNPPGTYCLWP